MRQIDQHARFVSDLLREFGAPLNFALGVIRLKRKAGDSVILSFEQGPREISECMVEETSDEDVLLCCRFNGWKLSRLSGALAFT